MCAVHTVQVCGRETTLWNPKAPCKRGLRSGHREHLCLLAVHPTLIFSLRWIVRYFVNICSPATSVHLAPNCMQTLLSALFHLLWERGGINESRREGQTSPVSCGRSNSDPVQISPQWVLSSWHSLFTAGLRAADLPSSCAMSLSRCRNGIQFP